MSDEETLAASLTQGAPPYQVTVLAVPGYGPGQSLLRYESEADAIGASIVILALCVGNDLADVASRRHLYDERWLRMLPDRSFLLAWFRPGTDGSGPSHEQNARRLEALRARSEEAADTLVAIVQRLRGEVERRGSRFVVAAFPDLRTLDPKSRRWPRLREEPSPRVDLLDLTPILARDQETYLRNTLDHIGHLSKQGHEHAARGIRAYQSP